MILLSHGFQAEYEIGFANGLATNGVPVTLVGSDNTLVERAVAGVRVINLRGSQDSARTRMAKMFGIARYVVRYAAYLIAHRGEPVHLIGLFSTRSSAFSLFEAWLTRLAAGPYMLTVHDLLPHDQHNGFNRMLYRLTYRAPDRFMTHTTRIARALARDFGVERECITVVEHGIDRFMPPDLHARAAWRAGHGLGDDATVALFFGKVMRYKGIDLLLDAFRSAGASQPALHLVIVGQCIDNVLRDELRAAIADHPLRNRIVWRNEFIAEAEISGVMQGADFVVMPYRYIDQSGVLFMAMSYGLPVIVTDVGSLAHYLPSGCGRVVPAGDTTALADALVALSGSLGSSPRNFVIQAARRYAWRDTIRVLAGPIRAQRDPRELSA